MTTASPSLVHDLLDGAARRFPEAQALTWQENTLTYARLAAASRLTAAVLREHGVSRGARVLVSTADRRATAAVVYGASRLGAVFCVVHEDVRGVPLEHVLQDSQAAVLVTDDTAARSTAQGLGVVCVPTDALVIDGVAPEAGTLDTVTADLPPSPALAVDPACLIYTSGTTSLPKAVVSTHQQVLFAARAIQSCLEYRADDTVYCPPPLSFDYGLYQLFLTALAGAHLSTGAVAEAGPALLRSLDRSGATVLAGVPSVSDALAWLLSRTSGSKLPRLRLLTNTGAALSERTMGLLRDRLPGLRIQAMYGLTECKRATIMPPDGDLEHPGSSGLPLPGTEVLVVDEEGEPLPPGEYGQIVVRGPHVMSGYWRRPELTAQRFPRREGLFPELHTGDYGCLDKDGYLYFSGRRDDLYKERGFRVSCTEVEAAAQRVEGVTSAVVLPPEGGRGAVLAAVSDLSEQEVLDRMRGQIEAYKVPARCVLLPELPTNGNGKFDRRRLAEALVENGTIREGRDSSRGMA